MKCYKYTYDDKTRLLTFEIMDLGREEFILFKRNFNIILGGRKPKYTHRENNLKLEIKCCPQSLADRIKTFIEVAENME